MAAAGRSGDTIWLGAIDGNGVAVSFIQSIYFEFGSGLRAAAKPASPGRTAAAAFTLDEIRPARARARPQAFPHPQPRARALRRRPHAWSMATWAAKASRRRRRRCSRATPCSACRCRKRSRAPRWLLGKTWGEESVTLKLEDRFDPDLDPAMRDAGHVVELVGRLHVDDGPCRRRRSAHRRHARRRHRSRERRRRQRLLATREAPSLLTTAPTVRAA